MINSRNLTDLHPTLFRGATELARRMKAQGYNMLVTSTYRDHQAQNALYAQGRTTAGNIVTNAKGGESIHNYRLACDICKNDTKSAYSDTAFFKCAGKIWEDMGGEWGGSWASFRDMPHFQFTQNITLAQLKGGKALPQNATMPWEKSDTQTTVCFNGKNVVVTRIFKDNSNYILLRDLEKFGLAVGYDSTNNMPTIHGIKS